MKSNIFIATVFAFLAVSCGGGEGSKEEQLNALRKQQTETQQKIAALEKELAAEGKNTGATVVAEVVAVTPAAKDTFKHYIEVQGRIDADQNVNVSPKVPGVLTSIKVQPGDKVKKGQLLATLDDAAVAVNLAEVRTQLDLANTVYEKQKRLWDQKIGTEIQFLQAKSNKESLERRLSSMQEQVAMYRITSPINGTVDQVNPKIGEAVSPGIGIVRVVNLDKTKLMAEVSEAYAARIKEGDEAQVRLPDLDIDFQTKVRVVSKAINPTNRTFTIEADIPANLPVRPNLVAVIKVNDYTNPAAITLPVNLVQKDDRGQFVFVAAAEEGKQVVRKKQVTTGRSSGGRIEILEGITPGDKVISTGYQQLNEGQAVSFKEPVAQK